MTWSFDPNFLVDGVLGQNAARGEERRGERDKDLDPGHQYSRPNGIGFERGTEVGRTFDGLIFHGYRSWIEFSVCANGGRVRPVRRWAARPESLDLLQWTG